MKNGVEFCIYGLLLAGGLRTQEKVCETHEISNVQASGLLSTTADTGP